MAGSTKWKWLKISPARPVGSDDPAAPSATDRQERIPGFSQAKLAELCALLIGAGGLNGETAVGLVRKGIGCLKIFDPDVVDLTNLHRQRFFARDLGENKAFALVRNLAQERIAATYLAGCCLAFQEAVREQEDTVCHVGICGVDNNRTRIFASQHFARTRTPLILTGVSNDGSHGYVFVQEPGAACFGCAFPDAVENVKDPCPNTPAVIDILKVVAGITLYAVDSLVMARLRKWNYKQVFLDGTVPERCVKVERRRDCRLCAGRAHG